MTCSPLPLHRLVLLAAVVFAGACEDPDARSAGAGAAPLVADPDAPAPAAEAPPARSRALAGGAAPARATTSGRRYDEVRQKSAHNAYQRKEAILDQLVYHRVRSIELDVHLGKSGWSRVPGDWYVYHTNIFDAGTTCHRLSDCLDELSAFHRMNPEHEVVTVWIDLKDGFVDGNRPRDLDERLTAHLAPAWLLTPAELLDRCPAAATLQQAVTGGCDWPALDELRGRFIVALTGGDLASPTGALGEYVAAGGAAQRLAFAAPDLDHPSDIDAWPEAVFFNLEAGEVALAAEVVGRYVSRVWGVNDAGTWGDARAFGAHHIATDKINLHRDPWAVTHNPRGWPFECFDGCAADLAEPARVVGVEVDSEDIWGGGDDFHFRYGYATASGNVWTASVATPNSHVDDWAKGCLMARESLAEGSPYFAVCRPADEHRLRVQWRSSPGGGSSAKDVAIVPDDTIDQESLTHVRLYVYDGDRCAAGYGSQDGQAWTLIGSRCFGAPLRRQGVAASSHGDEPVVFLFTNLALGGVPLAAGELPSTASIGTVRSARVFDGVFAD